MRVRGLCSTSATALRRLDACSAEGCTKKCATKDGGGKARTEEKEEGSADGREEGEKPNSDARPQKAQKQTIELGQHQGRQERKARGAAEAARARTRMRTDTAGRGALITLSLGPAKRKRDPGGPRRETHRPKTGAHGTKRQAAEGPAQPAQPAQPPPRPPPGPERS